ncbi:MAG: hypothetical protein Q7R90_00585 [bacterium]|nr:hypothetical protein [bacterium]
MEEITTGNERARVESSAERTRSIEQIYRAALAQHAKFAEIPEQKIKQVIEKSLSEIEELETAAGAGRALAALTPEIARTISAVWIFSGPGTYDKPVKEDRYKQYPWARGMDRARLSYGAWLVRKISEKVSGEVMRGPMTELPRLVADAREMISRSGPVILYNGTELENSVVKDVLTRTGIVIPPEKVMVAGEGIQNTVDQVKTFELPEKLHHAGGEIGIISHAPHLMRVTHMLSQYHPLPDDMSVRLFPIASPKEGREEYVETEIKALLYYVFIGKNAHEDAYPSIVHGAGSL